ncbi:MAG: hypothetical protein JNL70_25300 [Saprospiraceae bacterium]|nr:hypothetical protein [Saprospiraceae bacterium]
MRAATKQDKILVERIIAESFKDNPNVNYMLRPIAPKEKTIKRLADYAFDFAFKRNSLFISSDGKGLIVCCQEPIQMDWQDYLNLGKLIISALNIRQLGNILNRNAYINSIRPHDEKAIYIWCLALQDNGKTNRTAVEIKNFIFEKAKAAQAPIYVETALWKNKIAYERFGFKTYHYWESASFRLKTWFLKKNASPFVLTEANYMQ